MPEMLLDKREVCRRLGIKPSTLNRHVALGKIPRPFHPFGVHVPRWREADIDAYIRQEAGVQVPAGEEVRG